MLVCVLLLEQMAPVTRAGGGSRWAESVPTPASSLSGLALWASWDMASDNHLTLPGRPGRCHCVVRSSFRVWPPQTERTEGREKDCSNLSLSLSLFLTCSLSICPMHSDFLCSSISVFLLFVSALFLSGLICLSLYCTFFLFLYLSSPSLCFLPLSDCMYIAVLVYPVFSWPSPT